ncbi:MAG: aldehyde dehydrogenase (NAD+) [Akkermansiaceae bacterium]|jgi:aldehyde dehydrogenase (NAD+)
MKGAIRSGSVCLNDAMKQASSLDLPFGGVGESGSGRYRGKRGVETFCYERAVMKRYFVKDIFEMLPPRDKMARLLKKWL